MATAGKQGAGGSCNNNKPPATATATAAADQVQAAAELDPKYEWQENATSFILRIHLQGFRKQDFRVQVDGAGRLTVRGQRSDARHSSFSKVFQLPSTSNLDDIAGRFDAGVLTLTVPRRQPVPGKQQEDQAKAPPATAGDAKPPQPEDQRKAKEQDDGQAKKPKDEAATTKKPAGEQVADAKSGKPEPEQQTKAVAPPPPAVRKEEGKPKAGAAAAATPPPPAASAADTKKQATTPKPEQQQADAERRKAVDPESLAETVKRRAEEDRAKAAAAEAAAEEAAERQRKACRRGFKERVAEELQGLAASQWAEGLVDTVNKNREVIAAAVAAFSLGVLVSSKLFSRSRN